MADTWAKERAAELLASLDGGDADVYLAYTALREAEQRVIARLENPSDAMIEAVVRLTAMAMVYPGVGDANALDVKGQPRWKWRAEDARKFLHLYAHEFRALAAFLSSPPQEKTDG